MFDLAQIIPCTRYFEEYDTNTSIDESDQKKVYMTVFNYINENYIL